eukprot:gnl/TRDRNA2_/TRDRNA2_146672_c0_seq1.p1 gnl/TRDRNA2_/TRDRNA2_146672_c0~~gnl/TRDRNA2_/TRDRNA2_146672_c0_seq1.p1  ORF type:complete len:510 (+),score=91.42 gnl/TRDRNA2_/TRDRNA2_146672_c0_seq1:24-1532(+)
MVDAPGKAVLFSRRVLLTEPTPVPAVITVHGSVISAVTPWTGTGQPEIPGLLDLGERLITPAFVNAHTHLAMAALRGVEGSAKATAGDVVKDLYFRLEEQMTPEDVRAFARMGCYECLLSGIGLVWEHYYHGKALAEALVDTGLAGVVAPTLQDLSGPGVPLLEQALAETADIANDLQLRGSGVFAALGPHATDTVSDALWRRIVAVAKDLGGLPIHAHCGQRIQELEAVHARSGGLTPIALLDSLGVLSSGLPMMLVHGQYSTAADVARLDREKHVLCMCPRSHMLFAFPTPVPRWLAAGIRLALATDAAASNDDMNVQTEMRVLAGMVSFEATSSEELDRFWSAKSTDSDGMLSAARELHERRQAAHQSKEAAALRDPEVLLQSVWTTPGLLHPSFRAGKIESGALASLIVWDLEHPNLWPAADILRSLTLCDATPAIDGLMVAGRWIGRVPSCTADGDWQRSVRCSEAYRNACEEATTRLESLLVRAGLRRGIKRALDN